MNSSPQSLSSNTLNPQASEYMPSPPLKQNGLIVKSHPITMRVETYEVL